ncbi:MAG: hypothetical protein AB1324_05385 [Candidatus Micrarchaeota archaeon]
MGRLDREAAQRNRAAVDAFLDGIARRERGRKFRDPEAAFMRFSARAEEMVGSVKALEAKAAERAGRCGEEAIPARVFLSLSGLIERLCASAKAKKDIYALRVASKAAEKLAIDAEELLAVPDCPREAPARKAATLREAARAKEIYEVIMRTLDNTHREHGLEAPEFPQTSG